MNSACEVGQRPKASRTNDDENEWKAVEDELLRTRATASAATESDITIIVRDKHVRSVGPSVSKEYCEN